MSNTSPHPADVRGLRVLIVEDDDRMRDVLVRHLDRMGYDVRGAARAAEALSVLGESGVDLVVSDIRMPGMDGRTLLQIVREQHPRVKVVLMTAFGTIDAAVEAMQAGAYSYVCKPFRVEEMAGVLRNAAREILQGRDPERRPSDRHGHAASTSAGGPSASAAHPSGLAAFPSSSGISVTSSSVRQRFSVQRIIGNSAATREVRRLILDAAPLQAVVLITGRSGVGKEMVARAIHAEGPRASGPFVPVNCAAIPETLFESEMFGHRRGAFTGATRDQPGLVEQASGGTLFLDEIGELALGQQAKLLRVLQDHEVRPIGASVPVAVDARVLCATNQDLEALVRQGEFREDLYYRLNVVRIHVAELSARPEDIPPLAEHLLVEVARENNLRPHGLTDAALEALIAHTWPGNVRELRNAIERALLAARGRRVDAEDLPSTVSGGGPITRFAPAPAAGPAPTDQSLAALEKAHIAQVLGDCHWNRSAAARVLGIDRRTLFAKIQRYGLVGPLDRGEG